MMSIAQCTLATRVKLNSGYGLPILGLGVRQTPFQEAHGVCAGAIELGYRHIDSAPDYRNEAPCAGAITASPLPRQEFFFTSKVPASRTTYHGARTQVAATLATTQLGYIDLMLLQGPYGGCEDRKGAWRALVEAVEEGKVRSIGICNYEIHHLNELEQDIAELEAERGGKGKGGVISVGQWELHPWCQRDDIVEWCRKRGIAVEASTPLVRATRFGEPVLRRLAQKHGKSEAQVLIRWSLQKGFVPLPKSATPERIKENSEVFDWTLSEKEIKKLDSDEHAPVGSDPALTGLDD